jgi:hypothetical protein
MYGGAQWGALGAGKALPFTHVLHHHWKVMFVVVGSPSSRYSLRILDILLKTPWLENSHLKANILSKF